MFSVGLVGWNQKFCSKECKIKSSPKILISWLKHGIFWAFSCINSPRIGNKTVSFKVGRALGFTYLAHILLVGGAPERQTLEQPLPGRAFLISGLHSQCLTYLVLFGKIYNLFDDEFTYKHNTVMRNMVLVFPQMYNECQSCNFSSMYQLDPMMVTPQGSLPGRL